MLQIKNITKAYNDKKIIDDVSLNVDKGQIALLLGQSGVGKSTLLRILNNLESIDAGSIFLDDKKLDPKANAITHAVGMVFQGFNLFDHLTVQENITLALEKVLHLSRDQALAIADNLLAKYGLLDKKDKHVSQLSGGQKQRLAIARTVAMKPRIICMDEPTSALDPLLTSHVAKSIQELSDQGYIVLVASHDIALLDKLKCTIYLMQAGHIIESATSDEFKSNKSAYPALSKFIAGEIE
jgi:ABC-type polar amino acid transport system ATPase subunit